MIRSTTRPRSPSAAAARRGATALAIALTTAAATGCATVDRLGGPFGRGRTQAAPADTAAARPSPAEQRMERIEASLERQESLLRRMNADFSAQLDDLGNEIRVLAERVTAFEARSAARTPGGGPSLPGSEVLPHGERFAGLPAETLSWATEDAFSAEGPGSGVAAGESAPGEDGQSASGSVPGGEERASRAGPEAQAAGARPLGVSAEGQRTYEAAYQDLMQDNFQLALIGFRTYLERYPQTSLSDNAQYWIAEIYYKQRQFTTAIEEFIKVVEDFPGQDKTPAAYYKLGLCFRNLRDETTARRYFELLVAQHPGTREAQLAGERLSER